MKNLKIILLSLITIIYSSDPPEDFSYVQSTLQAFYMWDSVFINGSEIEPEDWVGVFNGDVCVGSIQWDISNCNNNVCAVVACGNDGDASSVDNLNAGDIPTFKIYDASEDIIYNAYTEGEVTINNEECLDGYPDCYVWPGNLSFIRASILTNGYDCAGELDGDAEIDCSGECDGNAEIDCSGVCNGDAEFDCIGECGGSAFEDECGICNGDGNSCKNASIETPNIPKNFELIDIYPNPFNPSTRISFENHSYQLITINIYNIQGLLIKQFAPSFFSPGIHSLDWDATNIPSGIYLVNLISNNKFESRKVILSK